MKPFEKAVELLYHNPMNPDKNRDYEVFLMYWKEGKEQLGMEEFFLPFEGRLDSENRWVKFSKAISYL